MNKLLLTIIVTILFASGVFAVFCLLTGNIDTMMGGLLAFASFAIVLWCLTLRKEARLGLWTFILLLGSVLLLPSTTLAYSGVEPFATGKDFLLSNARSNAETVTNGAGNIIPEQCPSGKYTTQKMGAQASVTFRSSDILEMEDAVNGRRIYEYKILGDGETIKITDVTSGNTTSHSFNYVKDYGIVVIDNVEYYKET